MMNISKATRILFLMSLYMLLISNQGYIFVKVRFLYWQEGKSDPKSFSEADQQERVFKAQRDSSCDETFASLGHEGDVSYLDPQSKPSRFIHLRGKLTGLPSPKAALPCYEVE